MTQAAGWRGALQRHGEAIGTAGLLSIVALAHVYTVFTHPTDRRIFWERNGSVLLEPSAEEFLTHLDRLITLRVWESCPSVDLACIAATIDAADRHHPFFTAWSASVWNFLVGVTPGPTLMLGLVWLLGLAFAARHLARREAGPWAGWMAAAMVLACPVYLGSSRELHQDMPMHAWLALFLVGGLQWARGGRWLHLFLALLGATLAVLTKWEAVLVVLGFGGAMLVQAALRPGRLRSFGGLGAGGGLSFGIWALYVRVADSSYLERPELHPSKVFGPKQPTHQSGPPEESFGHIGDRCLFYGEAMLASSVGLLISLLMLVGIGLALWRLPWRRSLVWLSALALPLGALLLAVPNFVDDRFVGLWVWPGLVLGAVGLAQLPLRGLGPVLVGAAAMWQIADLTHTRLMLPTWPTWSMPAPGAFLGTHTARQRTLDLRPSLPFGHAVWLRPETRRPAEIGPIQAVFDQVRAAGHLRLVLDDRTGDLGQAYLLWRFVQLSQESQSLQLMVRMGVDPTVAPRLVECTHGSASTLESWLQEGAVVVTQHPSGQPLWETLSCGHIEDPSAMGLAAHRISEVQTHTAPLVLWHVQDGRPAAP